MLGIELMHAAQAVDLRRRKSPGLPLGQATQRLYAAFRARVTFLDKDRPLTPDIRAAHAFVLAGGALDATAASGN